MNGGDRAAVAVRKSAVSLALAIPPGHGVGEDAQDLAQQCAVEGERKAQGKGQGQDPLTDGSVGQNVVDQSQGARVHAPAAAEKINIIDMMNKSAGNLAYNIIDVDGDASDATITKLRKIEGVLMARLIPKASS